MLIILIVSLMFAGVAIGYLNRNRSLKYVHKIITVLIWVLLFLLGMEVGNNPTIINGLHTIGIEALIITLAAVAGSVLMSWILWGFIVRTKKGIGK